MKIYYVHFMALSLVKRSWPLHLHHQPLWLHADPALEVEVELLEGNAVVGLLDVASHLVHRHRVEHLVAQLAHQCRQVRRHLHLAALLIVPVTYANSSEDIGYTG